MENFKYTVRVYVTPSTIYQVKPSIENGLIESEKGFNTKKEALSFLKSNHFGDKESSRFKRTSWDQEWKCIVLFDKRNNAIDYEILYA